MSSLTNQKRTQLDLRKRLQLVAEITGYAAESEENWQYYLRIKNLIGVLHEELPGDTNALRMHYLRVLCAVLMARLSPETAGKLKTKAEALGEELLNK